jgi:hypothetical protein
MNETNSYKTCYRLLSSFFVEFPIARKSGATDNAQVLNMFALHVPKSNQPFEDMRQYVLNSFWKHGKKNIESR